MDEKNNPPPDEEQCNPTILIEVSRDNLEAYCTVFRQENSPDVTDEHIDAALSGKGITVGIKTDVIDLLTQGAKYGERLLIASGTKPSEVKDGSIEYRFETNEDVRINKGDTVGEIKHPEEGTNGITVTGEDIPARETHTAHIPELINVSISTENEDELVADIDGYLRIDRASIQVTPFFELEVSDDKYEAYVTVTERVNDSDFGPEDLKGFLTEQEIVFGILEEEIETIFDKNQFDKKTLVAQGNVVENGIDGYITYQFDTEIKAKIDEKGNIDYRELNLIQQVHAGDTVAEVHPPKDGTAGCTVFNEEIQPLEGELPALPSGKNTRPDPDNPNILISEIEGAVKLKGTLVEVESMITIQDNVDYSTGNIDFDGPVIVKGDVVGGFAISSKDDVQVNGIVEDAVIETDGSVLIKGGFIGRGHGKIVAGGDVTVKFCENETIISESDIHIDEYGINCTIQASGMLYVTEKTGLLVGGETCAIKGIEAKIVGNEEFTHTTLSVGLDHDFNEKLAGIKKDLKINAQHLKDIDRVLRKFSRRELIKRSLPENKKKLKTQLSALQEEKAAIRKHALAEIAQLTATIDEFKKARVKISGVVYPGTVITIYDKHLKVEDSFKTLYYTYTDDEIVALDLHE